MSRRYVAIKDRDGAISIHIPSDVAGNWLTLCGDDVDADFVQLRQIDVPLGAKINCAACKRIWAKAAQYRESDFEKEND